MSADWPGILDPDVLNPSLDPVRSRPVLVEDGFV